MTDHHDENEITDFDRQIAARLAAQFDHGVTADDMVEMSAQIRRDTESSLMYVQVYGLSFNAGQCLVKADDHERYAGKNGWLTPAVAHAIAEVRRLAWANADDDTLLEALMASWSAVHEERMK